MTGGNKRGGKTVRNVWKEIRTGEMEGIIDVWQWKLRGMNGEKGKSGSGQSA